MCSFYLFLIDVNFIMEDSLYITSALNLLILDICFVAFGQILHIFHVGFRRMHAL